MQEFEITHYHYHTSFLEVPLSSLSKTLCHSGGESLQNEVADSTVISFAHCLGQIL